MKSRGPIIYTIGHSTRSLEELINILTGFHVKKLMDVRTIPKSRFNPQFNKEILRKGLLSHDIHYQHMPGLGGLRHPGKDSINTGWRNASFRGYADYMQTNEFEQNLQELIKEAQQHSVAIMCAEAVPWRCHRSLIADVLLARGFEVINIMGPNKGTVHAMNPMAVMRDNSVYYPKKKHAELFNFFC